jgi:NADH-quinone oxidoreductase subunit J
MQFGEVLLNVVFYLFALFCVLGSLVVALSTNIVRCAFSLLGVLTGVAALYGVAQVDFLMAIQILIYVGGILVLIVFAIMLTHRITDVRISSESTPSSIAVAVVICILLLLLGIFVLYEWEIRTRPPEALTEEIGTILMNQYLLPFEAISVLLLAALIGAAFLARKETKG